jgi:hypothetical protein
VLLGKSEQATVAIIGLTVSIEELTAYTKVSGEVRIWVDLDHFPSWT